MGNAAGCWGLPQGWGEVGWEVLVGCKRLTNNQRLTQKVRHVPGQKTVEILKKNWCFTKIKTVPANELVLACENYFRAIFLPNRIKVHENYSRECGSVMRIFLSSYQNHVIARITVVLGDCALREPTVCMY